MVPYLYALGAILCWASLPAAVGAGLDGLPTESLLFYSFTSAALYLYVQDVVRTRSVRLYLPGLTASLWGVAGIFGYHWVYYMAMDNAPLAEAAILATTWSFWIVVFSSVLVFKKLKGSIFATALMGMVGAGLVISSNAALSFDTAYMKGYLQALLCGLIWSSFSVALPRLNTRENPMTAFTVYAAVISAAFFLVTGPHPFPGGRALASAVYLGLVPLGLSFFLWNRAVATGNLSVIGFLSYLTPPLAVFLVAFIHGQRVSGQVLLGMGVIIAASVLGKAALGKDSGKA
ncbi:DMT family transporter [Desulfoluna butyratoxydans]|uniref:Eama domain n=1 Tax=Desulfoluna butyratoxydans TaxID=231438 RepID=A0A4U8YNL9_9BACT|nr:DMT family transporter [Desulfoluna butyratoxydans]VFQ44829.1 eama domain [Desulfoluna butyratoxydans]